MTKAEIVKYACTDKYKSICFRLTKRDTELAKDLHQEMLLVLLEYDEQKVLLVKEPKAFIYRILTNMACSSTSSFFKMYRRQLVKDRVINFHYENSSRSYHAKLKQVAMAVNSLEQRDKQIFKSFLDMGTATKVAKEYNMPYKKTQQLVSSIKEKVREKMKQVA